MLRIDPCRASPQPHPRDPGPNSGGRELPPSLQGHGEGKSGLNTPIRHRFPPSGGQIDAAEARRAAVGALPSPRRRHPGLRRSNVQNGQRPSLQREIGPSVAPAPVCYNPELFALRMTLVLIIYSSVWLDGPSAFQSEAFKPSLRCRHTERSKCFPWDPGI